MKIGFFAPDQTPVSTLACQFAGIKKILFLGDCFVIMYYLLSKKEDSLTKDKSKKTLLHMSFGKWFLNNPIFFSFKFKTDICRQKCLILILIIQICVKYSENEFISIDFKFSVFISRCEVFVASIMMLSNAVMDYLI